MDVNVFLSLHAGFGRAMVQPELWAAAALMLLGAAVSLCLRCQLSATKRETQLNERRSQLESQQRFEVIRSHTAATRRLEKSKEPEKLSIASKANEGLSASHHTGYGSRDQARYQNFLAENCLEEDTAYVEPMSLDHYYNCTRLFKPPCGRSPGKPEKDEDSYSYENVTIGVSQGSDPDEAVDYENSMTVLTWKLQQGQAPVTESLDDEPDYINTDPAVRAKAQELQSALEQLEPALLHAVGAQSPCSEQGFPQLSPACCARTTHPAPLSPPDRCC
ncbi:linker for activation of T-cells family member 2 isoform X2 [Taeniopygia guttata]|uniref:linker for activation of T-cells family member 2 isoform X2 n=2 Tax=Taeniopygia guttata TaxID=59729 RepID=UPI003BB8C75B